MAKIPKNLEECFLFLEKFGNSEEFKALKDNEVIGICHHTTGRNIRNQWKLWEEDTPIVKWFNEKGIKHADDMSAIILLSFHRKINGRDIQLEEQISGYKEYWEAIESAQKTKYKYISEKKMGSNIIKIKFKGIDV